MSVDRLFLDANVLFSAAYRPASEIASLWRIKNVELLTSAYAAEEAGRNLADEAQRHRLRELLDQMQIVTGASPLPHGVRLPEKDRPILQAAIYARATHLLTGDQHHFGKHYGKRYGAVLILPLGDYLEGRG
jgi:uncharacterized protein